MSPPRSRSRRRRGGGSLLLGVLRGVPVVAILGLGVVMTIVQTQANTVPTTRAVNVGTVINANTLKPSSCSGITLTAIVRGSGTFAGTAANELILGSSGVDTMSGQGGNDCLLGGAGNDSLNGGTGTDVCIGGLGTDTFNSNCETQIQ